MLIVDLLRMSIATKLGLAYSLYYRDPYRSRREVILSATPCRGVSSREQENSFFSAIIATSLHSGIPLHEGLKEASQAHDSPPNLAASLHESRSAARDSPGVVVQATVHGSPPVQQSLAHVLQVANTLKESRVDAVVQADFVAGIEPPFHSGNGATSSESPPPLDMRLEEEEVDKEGQCDHTAPHRSLVAMELLSEKEPGFPMKLESSPALKTVLASPSADVNCAEDEPTPHQMKKGSTSSLQSEGEAAGDEKKREMPCNPDERRIDVGVGMDETKVSRPPELQDTHFNGVSEEKSSLQDSLKHMIPATCLSEIVDCILHKIQIQNVRAVALDDLIQQLTKNIPSLESNGGAQKPVETKEKVASPHSLSGGIDGNSKRELSIHLYSLRDQVQQLATQVDAREKVFQRRLREYSAKRNESRKVTVEIVKGYDDDPKPYKKPPFRSANIKNRNRNKDHRNSDTYEDDFTYDEEESEESNSKETKSSGISSFSSSSSSAKGGGSAGQQKKNVKGGSVLSSRSSSFISTDSEIARIVPSSTFSASTRRSDSTPTTSSSFTNSSSSYSSSFRKRSQKAPPKKLPEKRTSSLVGKKTSLGSSSSLSSNSFISSSSSSTEVEKMDEVAVKDFWARQRNRNLRQPANLSSSSSTASSSR